MCVKAEFHSVEVSKGAEILLFTRENVTRKLERMLRLNNLLLVKLLLARKFH